MIRRICSKLPVVLAWLVITLTALGLSPSETQAQSLPTVTISPRGKLVTSGSVEVTVEFCQLWGGTMWTWGSEEFRLDGVNVNSQFSWSSTSQNGQCETIDTWTGTLTLNASPLNQVFRARLWSGGYLSEDMVTYAVPAVGRGVLVASTVGFRDVSPSASNSQQFQVWNTGSIATTYSVGSTCSGAASSCSASPGSFSLGVGASATVSVSFNSSGTVGDTGLVKLNASDSDAAAQGITIQGEGWTDITVKAAPTAGVVIARSLGPVNRGSCVSVSVGSDAAMECGDLRITHALPGVTTLGKARAPTLIYNSQFARPVPVVLGDVTIPTGSLPTTVQARVYVDGVLRGSRDYAGSDWAAGGDTRRIAVEVDATGYGTSHRNYELQITLVGGPGGYYAQSGNLAVVDRSSSHFGAGWWLAGLEEIYFPNPSTILWIGGDGSTRYYSWNGASFKAADFDHPDSITTSGSDYIRWGPAKLQVRFNSAGLHTSTTNRLGQVTSFAYVPGTRRLSSITVPVNAGSPLTYSFTYGGTGVLNQVSAPSAGVGRTVTIGHYGDFQNTSITDPDGKIVYFAYGPGANQYRIENRTDRRGYVTTFWYNSANHLTQSSLALGGGNNITTVLRAAESFILGLVAHKTDSVYTMIDGPRSDVTDVTTMWINKYGAPTRVRNAEGRETALWYDTNWPGLVSQTRSPSRLLTKAIHNSDATLQSSTVYNPLGTGANNTTTYTWDPTWKFVTSVTPQVGPVTEFSYLSNGNRAWEQTGGSSRRVTYHYNASNLLDEITPPGLPATTLVMNDLGNVMKVISPKGFTTWTYQNAIGQDTLIASPFSDSTLLAESYVVPAGASNGVRVIKRYTLAGQDSIITTHGPLVYNPLSGQNVQRDSVRLDHLYDAEGNVTSSTRRYWPNGGGGSGFILQSSWTYDGAGRKLTEAAPGAGTKTFGYDPAGNVTSVLSPRGHTVTMTYDNLNRLKQRIVPQLTFSAQSCYNFFGNWGSGCYWSFPTITGGSSVCVEADTARFEYEPAGAISLATNRYAKVARTYKPNGLLATDQLRIRSWHEPGDSNCGATASDAYYGGAEWSAHVYTQTHTYDIVGRRTQTDGPYSVSGCLQSPCRTTWAYTGGAGELTSVTDGLNRTTTLAYDLQSRLDYIQFANGVWDDPTYDSESRAYARYVWGSTAGYMINDVSAYDASGRVARATQSGQSSGTVNTYYGPMGAVIGVTGATYSETGSPVTERFDVDALGNRTYSQQLNHKPATHPDVNGDRTHTHDSYKRLTNVFATPGIGWYHNKDLSYDNAGNLNSTSLYEADQGSNTVYDASLNYYDAGDRLVVFNRAVGPFGNDETHPGQRGVFEEYRYDALGRRVAVRSRRTSSCPGTATECQQYVERTVWDGDNVIFEVRAPGSNTATSAQMEADYGVYSGNQGNALGQTAYVHAGGIDQPIVVMRTGYNGSSTPISVHPHQNWRGVFELGTKSDGTLLSYFSGSPQIAWPGAKTLVDGVVGNQGDGPIWFGGLIPGKSDGSGMQYMRNRYYDPATGKFTQQDPIGLAGGMNLYGFAGGDKINFSDPFGLDPYVNCRPTKASADYGHCAIRVYDPSRKLDVTMELIPSGRKKEFWFSGPFDPKAKAYDNQWARVDRPAGMSEQDFDNAVINAANAYATQHRGTGYFFTGGTNSNRFVYDVLKSVGAKVPEAPTKKTSDGAPGACGGSGMKTGTDCKK